MPFVVLLDASVHVPAALRDTLLRAAEADLYRPVWSEQILGEVGRTLVARLGLDPAAVRRLVSKIHAAFPEAEVRGYERLTPVMPVDEDDRHVAAAAIVGHAQVIVTLNLRDFPPEDLAPFGIDVQHPDDFLLHLFTLYPDPIVRIIEGQASALRSPPRTPFQICDALALHVPSFAGKVRKALSTGGE